MKKIIKEPLFQFLTIGALLFVVYGLINTAESKDEIVIDNYLVNELTAKWKMKRDRQPNLQELKGMVNEYITQEVLYREALAMNLDYNDEIIKRRLAQKMEFLSDELAESLQPTEEMLKEYYEKNKENYTRPSVYTLQQVYFSNDKRTNAFADAQSALKADDPQELGDYISLNAQFTNVSASKIARDFGAAFAIALDSLPIREWAGPIHSGFGVHLVYISEKEPSGYFTFKEVVDKVNIDYNYHASNDFKKELITTFLEKYTISFQLDDSEIKSMLSEGL